MPSTILKITGWALALATLSACMGGSSQTASLATSQSAMSAVMRAGQTQPSEKDMAMSCKAIDAELTGLYAQFEEINKAERARERKAGLTSGLLSAGISFAGISALGNAGSVQAMQNIGTATSVASTAASASQGAGGPNAQTLNKATAIQERSAVLERAKLAKGC